MDVSGIASLSMYMSQAKVMQEMGTAVLGMAIEQATDQGQNAAAIMEASVNPDVGQNIDLMV
ncbi:MAG: YjfB family protein [Lachnospiraceae bacterium]|nr:YjfB family protein [Lachnospiraceae bacterium]